MRTNLRRSSIRPSWSSGFASCALGSTSSGGVFDEAGLRERASGLEVEAGQPDLWEDRERAEKLLRTKRAVDGELKLLDRPARRGWWQRLLERFGR